MKIVLALLLSLIGSYFGIAISNDTTLSFHIGVITTVIVAIILA